MSQNGYVYILDAGDVVKIGTHANPLASMIDIEHETGKTIFGFFVSRDCSNYDEIASLVRAEFSDNCMEDEWLDVEYDEAVDVLKSQQFKDSAGKAPIFLATP